MSAEERRTRPHPDPEDRWRLVRVATPLLSQFGTRTERGEHITAEWGEPDAWGVYEPIFTVHSDDVLDAARASADAARLPCHPACRFCSGAHDPRCILDDDHEGFCKTAAAEQKP